MADITDKKGTGFFEETPGNKSMVRLGCFLCIVQGILVCTFASYAAYCGKPDAWTMFTIGISLVGAGLAGKVAQKYTE